MSNQGYATGNSQKKWPVQAYGQALKPRAVFLLLCGHK